MATIALITDTWLKNTNGVVASTLRVKEVLEARGNSVTVIHGDDSPSIGLPSYPEIRLVFMGRRAMERRIRAVKPDSIHIVTEGPLGFTAIRACRKSGWKFTTAYHTNFADYIALRVPGTASLVWRYIRWFHNAGERTLVSTESLRELLARHGISNTVISRLGVDIKLFTRNPNAKLPGYLKKPIFVFFGRVAPEKNIRAFLECDLPGSKLVIGDGPSRALLAREFEGRAIFAGYAKGQALVDLLSVSDCLVFPSRTDTFGLTIIEAMACGIPVAAFDVPGPKDIITNGVDGFLGDDLAGNAISALKLDPAKCREKASHYTWEHAADDFLKNLVPARIKSVASA